MLIFYVKKETSMNPIVIIDAMSSDDRFTTTEIKKAVSDNMPTLSAASPATMSPVSAPQAVKTPQVFSCEYSAQFEHIGMPLGSAIKTRFSGALKSPPAALVSAFSPSFLTSSQSVEQLADSLSTIPNAQTNVVYTAMVFKADSGKNISRQFIVYSAPMFPDPFGTTVTMVLSGAMIDDTMIKTTTFCQIDKKTPLKSQIDKFLASQNPPLVGNYDNAPQASSIPATEILLKPMKLFNLLSEICLQNKMIFSIDYAKSKVSFYGVGQSNAPKALNYIPPKFSFLGSNGAVAWGLGIENYTNIKFKTPIFDSQLFTKVVIYNDISSAVFGGLTKNPSPAVASLLKKTPDSYDAWIIRYVMRWNRQESICEVTASNNWLMSQFRLDALLESAIYSQAAIKL